MLAIAPSQPPPPPSEASLEEQEQQEGAEAKPSKPIRWTRYGLPPEPEPSKDDPPGVDVDGLIHPTEKELKESGQRSLRKCLKALGCCSMIGVFFGERPD